jgi:two-component system, LuxR family, sensor kinase FixL
LIDDLLDLSKAEAGRLTYDFALSSIDQVIRGVMHEMESLAEVRQITLVHQAGLDDPYIEMDADRIGQVLRNLLSNAIKFSPPGGRIDVDVDTALLDGPDGPVPAICMQVRDQGPGIPEDELEQVFEKFVQSRSNDRRHGGTGLGLAITNEIVHAHLGTVSACNQASGGACFATLLPRRRGAKGLATVADA